MKNQTKEVTPKPDIDFDKLMREYKSKNFKTMKTVHHEFLYTCFHPKDEDIVIALERNMYPEGVQIYDLVPTEGGSQKADESVAQSEGKEQENQDQSLQLDKGQTSDKQTPGLENMLKDQIKDKVEDAATEQLKSTFAKNLLEVPGQTAAGPGKEVKEDENEGKEVEQDKKFEFEPKSYLKEEKEITTVGQYTYAISMWKLNKGRNPVQVAEYGFNGSPAGMKFYISHDGNQVFFFLSVKDEAEYYGYTISKMVTLQTIDLKFKTCYDLPAELKLSEIVSASLIKGSQYLCIQNGSDNQYHLIWLAKSQIVGTFPKYFYQERRKDGRLKKANQEEDFQLGMLAEEESETISTEIVSVLFKAQDPHNFYMVIRREYDTYCFVKIKFPQGSGLIDLTKPFDAANELWSVKYDDVGYIQKAVGNRILDKFIFASGETISYITPKTIKTMPPVVKKQSYHEYDMEIQKNTFLYDNMAVLYLTENGDIAVAASSNLTKKYDLDIATYNSCPSSSALAIRDCRLLQKGGLEAIGLQEGEQGVQVSYIENEEVYTNFMREISEMKCLYPYVFFCKGNKELYVQSLNQPKKLLRLDMEKSIFLCFVDISNRFEILEKDYSYGETIKENETLAFLTECGDKIHLKILQYSQFDEPIQYWVNKSIRTFNKKDFIQESIVKAAFINAERKEVKSDYIIAIQYRTQLIMKSFVSPFTYSLDKKSMVPMQMIYVPNADEWQHDNLFFLQKEGGNIKVQRIHFAKTKKEYNVTVLEIKANLISLFQRHGNKFCIMDDTNQIKEYDFDAKNDKMKYLRSFEPNKDEGDQMYFPKYSQLAFTGRALHQQNYFYAYHNTQERTKNYDFLNCEDIFSCQSSLQGPFKLEECNSLMFVVHNYYPEEKVEEEEIDSEDEDQKLIDADNKVVDKFKNNLLAGIRNRKPITQGEDGPRSAERLMDPRLDTGREDHKEKDDFTVEDVGDEHDEKDKKNQPQYISPFKGQNSQKSLREEKNFWDENEGQAGNVDIVFVPYIDKNEISLVYNNTDQNRFYNVAMTTIMDTKGHILAKVGEKFLIYKDNGTFMGPLDLKDSHNVSIDPNYTNLMNISDNMQYYLFQNNLTNTFYVYKKRPGVNQGPPTLAFIKEIAVHISNFWSPSYFKRPYINDLGIVYQISLEENEWSIYEDDQVAFDNIKSSFSLFGECIDKKESFENFLSFCFIGCYLFIRKDNQVEYIKLFNKQKGDCAYAQFIKLNLDDDTSIQRIVSTQESNVVQLLFVDAANNLSVVNWDLDTNIEYSMLQLNSNKLGADQPINYIVKGLKRKLNYIVTNDCFYDLQFLLPFTFMKTGQTPIYPLYDSVNETKLTANCNLFLGVEKLSSVYTSYSLFDLYFWKEWRQQFTKPEDWNASNIHLDHLKPRYGDTTIFHMFNEDYKFLSVVFDEVKRTGTTEGNPWLRIFLQAIYPNNDKMTPFDLTVKSSSPKCIEIMLEMFIQLTLYRVSPFIRKHFTTLFATGLTVFEKYLDICTFKHISMEASKPLEWVFEEDEMFVDYHTSYLGEEFIDRLLNYKKSKVVESVKSKLQKKQPEPAPVVVTEKKESEHNEENNGEENQDEKQLSVADIVLQAQAQDKSKLIKKRTIMNSEELNIFTPKIGKQDSLDEKKRVEFSVLEFDWIFHGDGAKNFITKLANTDNDNLFAIETVRVLILFLWQKFFIRIILWVFLPFIVYHTFFVVYVTFIYERQIEDPESEKWMGLDYFFIAVILACIAFFLSLELRQIYNQGISYFSSGWTYLDLTSFALNIAFIACDLNDLEPTMLRPLGSVAVLIMWLKFFYFLRLFQPTAQLIRMITEICKEMATFAFVLLIAMVGFGNTFYILAVNGREDPEEDLFTGQNFLMALIYSFRLGLGDFDTEGYGITAEALIWIIFLAEAILIQIVLLNLLIAIMGNTFAKVTELGELSKLKEICSMIAENEFVLDRKKLFQNSKYIIVARLEKANAADPSSIEGQVSTLKTYITDMIANSQEDTKSLIEQKFNENQNLVSKLSALVMKEIKTLSVQVQTQKDEAVDQIAGRGGSSLPRSPQKIL